MYRTLLAALIAPLGSPFLIGPATDFSLHLLAGTMAWDWAGLNALFHTSYAADYLVTSYLQMALIFLPLCLLCRKRAWMHWWVFLGAGLLLGHLTFFIVVWIPTAVQDPATAMAGLNQVISNPSRLRVLLWLGETRHAQLGATITSGVVMGLFWIIAVPRNSWFHRHSEPVAASDTTEVLDLWD